SEWLRIRWTDRELGQENVEAWVMRNGPDGEPLFTSVSQEHETKNILGYDTAAMSSETRDDQNTAGSIVEEETLKVHAKDFYALVARVQALEDDLHNLRLLLRSA